jgi:hypothetical protein
VWCDGLQVQYIIFYPRCDPCYTLVASWLLLLPLSSLSPLLSLPSPVAITVAAVSSHRGCCCCHAWKLNPSTRFFEDMGQIRPRMNQEGLAPHQASRLPDESALGMASASQGNEGSKSLMVQLMSMCDPIMRLANWGAPLQDGKVWHHIWRWEEHVNHLKMRLWVWVLWGKVHHQRRSDGRACGEVCEGQQGRGRCGRECG